MGLEARKVLVVSKYGRKFSSYICQAKLKYFGGELAKIFYQPE